MERSRGGSVERERQLTMDQESEGTTVVLQEAPPPAMGKEVGGGKKRRSKQGRRSEGGRGRKARREYGLVSYHELPEYMKENEFILNHYRSEWPLVNAFLSVFAWHNETINIWTYVLSTISFSILVFFSTVNFCGFCY